MKKIIIYPLKWRINNNFFDLLVHQNFFYIKLMEAILDYVQEKHIIRGSLSHCLLQIL